jgi:hypothetical protein
VDGLEHARSNGAALVANKCRYCFSMPEMISVYKSFLLSSFIIELEHKTFGKILCVTSLAMDVSTKAP